MKNGKRLLLPLLAVAAACGGSGSGGTQEPINSNSAAVAAADPNPLPSNQEVLTLVYDHSYTVPDDFFVDERADTDRSYTIHHVLDDSSSYELCTDDYAVAAQWEEEDNASRSVQGYYVSSYENARYFEFIRELSYTNDVGNIDDITSPGFARIFKCSHQSRNGVDRTLLNGYAGTLNSHPLDTESVRNFTEYLWQFTFFPNSNKKVLDSYGQQHQNTIDHSLLLTFTTNQGIDRCDLIEVAEWRFSARRNSGEITRSFEILRSFEARLTDGTPEICD